MKWTNMCGCAFDLDNIDSEIGRIKAAKNGMGIRSQMRMRGNFTWHGLHVCAREECASQRQK